MEEMPCMAHGAYAMTRLGPLWASASASAFTTWEQGQRGSRRAQWNTLPRQLCLVIGCARP
jgi:hypothetical protein